MMKRLVLVLALAAPLAACGTSPGGRAVSGGLLGAGAGALVGSAAGSAGTGALIGGGLGAAGGALTAPSRRRGYADNYGYSRRDNYYGRGDGYYGRGNGY
jgi:hypothetical protein